MKKIFLIIGIIYWAVLGSGKAQVLSGSLGTSWLKISPSTRNVGMGDSALAVPDAYDEADINPAGLGLMGGTYLSLSQDFYVQGLSAQHLIFTQAGSGGDGFSIGANYINFGNIETYNVVGSVLTSTGSYSPIGLNLYAAYGMGLGDGLRAGLTGHFIYDDIQENFPDKTAALDGGLYFHQPDRPFYLSAVMTNLGWNIDDSTLPLEVKMGGAYQWVFGQEKAPHVLTLSGEADMFLNDGNYAQLGVGAEYWYKNLIGLRAGYQFSNIGDLTGLTGLSLGAGIKYWNWQLDYALITLGELGVANQISLSVKLGGDEPTATPTKSPTPVITPTFTPTTEMTPVISPTPEVAPPEVLMILPTATVQAVDSATPVENTPTMTTASVPSLADHPVTINADFKSSLPYDKDMETLNQVADFLAANPSLKIAIDGYTDNRGPKAVNVTLSVARAGLVKDYLIKKGVSPQSILWAKGHAAENPVGDNSTDEGRLQNRRVVIQWVPEDQVSTISSEDTTGTLAGDVPEENQAVSSNVKIDSAKPWWGETFDAQTAYHKLIKVIVPVLVSRHQLVLLGYHRQLFFDEARKQRVERRQYLSMVSGYYTAVAKNLVRSGDMKDAEFYLNLALVYQAYNLDALKLQPQVDSHGGT